MNDHDDEQPDVGECCECRGTEGVRNIIMFPFRAPEPGAGWGCVQCGLPSDGAIAVLCDDCLHALGRCAEARPAFICAGLLNEKKRIPLKNIELVPFDHDMSKHPEVENGR